MSRPAAWNHLFRLVACVALAALLSACATPDRPGASAVVNVSLISFNDLHGNLLPPGVGVPVKSAPDGETVKIEAGGIAHLSALIQRLQAMNPGNTLVVAAGDLVGASPQVSGAFYDEPTIEALNRLGLELSAAGNHEFDRGRDELLRLQNGGCAAPSADGKRGVVGFDTCMRAGRFGGATFRYLAANVIDQRSGEPLLPPYALRTLGGVKLAFVGVTLRSTPSIVSPKGVSGLRFGDEVEAVNRLIPELKRAGAAFVVVLLHQGATTSAEAINDSLCPDFDGEALRIADKLDSAVEVVITGHTHQEYVCRRPDGKLLTQAGYYGRMATRIDLKIDPASGKVLEKSARTHVAAHDAGAPEAELDALARHYAQLVEARSGEVVGRLAAPLERKANAAGESPLGKVIADAYLFGAVGTPGDVPPAQIAFVNPGGIRASLDRTAEVSYGDLYRIHPFANTVVTVELSGAQVVRLLEQQWERPQPRGGRVLAVSSGFSYVWDAAQPAGAASGQGQRIVPGSVRLHGQALDPERRYRVAVNNYLAFGGDNFSLLAKAPQLGESPLDIEVLAAYFRAHGTVGVSAVERVRRRD